MSKAVESSVFPTIKQASINLQSMPGPKFYTKSGLINNAFLETNHQPLMPSCGLIKFTAGLINNAFLETSHQPLTPSCGLVKFTAASDT